jgi:hypothetical protein
MKNNRLLSSQLLLAFILSFFGASYIQASNIDPVIYLKAPTNRGIFIGGMNSVISGGYINPFNGTYNEKTKKAIFDAARKEFPDMVPVINTLESKTIKK